MTREELRQFNSMMCEIMEEERRREQNAAYSLFGDDHDVIDRCRADVARTMEWLRQIPDSMTRRAFKLRYLDGLPWVTISCRLGYTEDSGARKLCERYLARERMKKSS